MRTVMTLVLALLTAASIMLYYMSELGNAPSSSAPSKPASAPSIPVRSNLPPASSPGPTPMPPPESPLSPAPQTSANPLQERAPAQTAVEPRPSEPPAGIPQSDLSPPAQAQADWPPSSSWTQTEERVLELTNVERRKAGLASLAREDGLHAAARAQSLDMLARHFFDHVNPSGEDPSTRIGRIHRTLVGTAGENLWKAVGPAYRSSPDLAAFIVNAWMNSPQHRENILRANFTHLGVGVVLEGDEVRATQNFSGLRAYLKTALPASLPSGASANLSTVPEARMFKLQPVDKSANNLPPCDTAAALLAAPPGVYRIEFYFPEDRNRFSIFEGPQITLR